MKQKLFKLTVLALSIHSVMVYAGHNYNTEINLDSQNTYDSEFKDRYGTLFAADTVNINFKEDQNISGKAEYLKLSTRYNENKDNRNLYFIGKSKETVGGAKQR